METHKIHFIKEQILVTPITGIFQKLYDKQTDLEDYEIDIRKSEQKFLTLKSKICEK